jgi:hypothetical protein
VAGEITIRQPQRRGHREFDHSAVHVIEDGAYFKGSIEIDKSTTKQADKSISSGEATGGGAGAEPKSI